MLFERRMSGGTRLRLSSFFTPEALVEAHRRVSSAQAGGALLGDDDLTTQPPASSRRSVQHSSSLAYSDDLTLNGLHASTSMGETLFDDEGTSRHVSTSVEAAMTSVEAAMTSMEAAIGS